MAGPSYIKWRLKIWLIIFNLYTGCLENMEHVRKFQLRGLHERSPCLFEMVKRNGTQQNNSKKLSGKNIWAQERSKLEVQSEEEI